MNLEALKRDLDGIRIEDNPAIVRQKSRDFFWYSPILKDQLDHITADIVATPKSEDEIVRILKACYAHDVPVTTRGSGTGNYGQAMPLSGGLVLNLAEMNAVREIKWGSVVVEAGAILAHVDKATRAHSRQELRMSPSTYNLATVGGFVAGGSGGIGSIRWGGLRDPGNVMRMRIVTMEAEPRVMDLTGDELMKVMHAYGTNGVITGLEMPLTAAYDWVDVIVGFDDFMDAARFGADLAEQDGLLTKLVTPIAAPIPHDYFKRHQKYVRRDQSIVVTMVAPQAMDAFLAFVARSKGAVVFRADTETDLKGLPPAYELTWNHTTLRAIRVDPTITYLQVRYLGEDYIERVGKMVEIFGDEVPGHIELIRFDGKIGAAGLPLVRFTTKERLEEIMRIHEDHGCLIFNPHRYTLEEGGMKQTDQAQLAFKREVDPKGLLNPGKMIAWDNPDFDFDSGRTYLFPGLQRAS